MKEIDFEQNKKDLLMMKQVSDLIQEVRPYFLEEKKRKQKIFKTKAICAAVFLMLFSGSMGLLKQKYDIVNTIVYNDLTATELGFPTDEYGLISVDFDEF